MSTATNGSTKRPAGIIYTAIADFENGEQYGADDVWQKLLETIPGSALDNGSTANLWSMVFNDNWNSDCPTESVPPTPGRSALEPMVICGTFNQDLPESVSPSILLFPPKVNPQFRAKAVHLRTGKRTNLPT